MAGNHNSGRKRKSAAELKLYGTFCRSRHANRADDLFPAGNPEKPVGMSPEGKRIWQLIVGGFPQGTLSPLDGPMLAGMSEWFAIYWGLHREVAKAGKCEPATITAMQTAWRCFRDSAIQFGMTPSARSKFEKAGSEGIEDLESFMSQAND